MVKSLQKSAKGLDEKRLKWAWSNRRLIKNNFDKGRGIVIRVWIPLKSTIFL